MTAPAFLRWVLVEVIDEQHLLIQGYTPHNQDGESINSTSSVDTELVCAALERAALHSMIQCSTNKSPPAEHPATDRKEDQYADSSTWSRKSHLRALCRKDLTMVRSSARPPATSKRTPHFAVLKEPHWVWLYSWGSQQQAAKMSSTWAWIRPPLLPRHQASRSSLPHTLDSAVFVYLWDDVGLQGQVLTRSGSRTDAHRTTAHHDDNLLLLQQPPGELFLETGPPVSSSLPPELHRASNDLQNEFWQEIILKADTRERDSRDEPIQPSTSKMTKEDATILQAHVETRLQESSADGLHRTLIHNLVVYAIPPIETESELSSSSSWNLSFSLWMHVPADFFVNLEEVPILVGTSTRVEETVTARSVAWLADDRDKKAMNIEEPSFASPAQVVWIQIQASTVPTQAFLQGAPLSLVTWETPIHLRYPPTLTNGHNFVKAKMVAPRVAKGRAWAVNEPSAEDWEWHPAWSSMVGSILHRLPQRDMTFKLEGRDQMQQHQVIELWIPAGRDQDLEPVLTLTVLVALIGAAWTLRDIVRLSRWL